jgi:hypothetical protein
MIVSSSIVYCWSGIGPTYSDFWNVWTQNGFNHPTRLMDAWDPVTNPNSTIPALSMSNPNDERVVVIKSKVEKPIWV